MSGIDSILHRALQLIVGKTIVKAEGFYDGHICLTFEDGETADFYARSYRVEDTASFATHINPNGEQFP